MNTKLLVIALFGTGLVAGVGYLLTDRLFLTPYHKIRAETERYREAEEGYKESAKGARDIKIGLTRAGETMLGGQQNVVEHRVRSMLSELAERNGLGSIVVSPNRPRPVGSPADAKGTRVPRQFRRLLSERPDFLVIRGRVQGLGSLEQIAKALADMRAQPWVHRVEGFTIAPKDIGAGTYELKADFATMYSPDLVDSEAPAPGIHTPQSEDFSALNALAARQPFRFAPPPAPVVNPEPKPKPVVQAPKPEPAPPPPPYDKWRVTGVLENTAVAGGIEVMLHRIDTGETKSLRVGQSVLGATLTKASGERAWFDKDGAPVVLRAGDTLAQAQPDESVHSNAASPD